MNNNCDCNISSNCTVFNGNSVDINLNSCDCEIRADVVLSEYKAVRLWGRVVNCDGKPVENALIKLVKVEYGCDCDCKHEYYRGIAHSISDCNGFYQFELCNYDDKSKYKLLVNKATYGSETVIPIEFNECNPCKEHDICFTDSYKHQISNLKHIETCNEKCTENKCCKCENKCNKYEVNYAYKDPKYYYSNKF